MVGKVTVTVERVGRNVKLTLFNTEESAATFRRLWTGIGFCEWGKAHLALPKKTFVSDSYSGTPICSRWGKYELALGALYNALTNPTSDKVDIIECSSLPHAEKVFHNVSRILDNVLRQISVAVRDMAQVADETRTITVDF